MVDSSRWHLGMHGFETKVACSKNFKALIVKKVDQKGDPHLHPSQR